MRGPEPFRALQGGEPDPDPPRSWQGAWLWGETQDSAENLKPHEKKQRMSLPA